MAAAPDPERLLADLERVVAELTSLMATYAPLTDRLDGARVHIPGTALTMVPPPGFVPSERFRGFESVEHFGASIMVVATPAPYAEATAGFDESPLAAAGMELLGRDPIRVSGVRGLRLDVAQAVEGLRFRKTVLAFGDATATTIVNASWLDDDDDATAVAVAPLIAASLATLEFDATRAADPRMADPRGALGFTIDETLGRLRQAAVVGTGLLINRHGRIAPDEADQTAVLVDRSHSAPAIEDKALFVELRMRQLPGNWHRAPGAQAEAVTYGGLDGYRVRAIDEASAREEAATIAVVYEPAGGYYVLMGMYSLGDEVGRADAERVMGSFRMRGM